MEFKTPEHAKKYRLDQMLAQSVSESVKRPKAGSQPAKVIWKAWLDTQQGLRQSSKGVYELTYRHLVAPFDFLDQIDTAAVFRLVGAQRWKVNTRRKRLGVLKAFLEWAGSVFGSKVNADFIQIKRLRQGADEESVKKWLKDKEVEKIRAYLATHYPTTKQMFQLACCYGFRGAELVQMTLGHWRGRDIRLPGSITKSRKNRAVPVAEAFKKDILKLRKEAMKKHGIPIPKQEPDDAPLWIDWNTGSVGVPKNTLKARYYAACRESGITGKPFHRTRAYALHFLVNICGFNLDTQVRPIVGWDSEAVRHYINDAAEEIAEKGEEVWELANAQDEGEATASSLLSQFNALIAKEGINELAIKSKVSASWLRYIKGRRTYPTIGKMERVAAVFGATLGVIQRPAPTPLRAEQG